MVGASEGVAPKLSILTAKKIKTKVEYFTVKVRGFPSQAKKKDIKQFFAPQKPDSIRLPPKIKGVAYLGFATEIEWKKALNKNRSFHGKSNSKFSFSQLIELKFRGTPHIGQ